MTGCQHCAALWSEHGQAAVAWPHAECLAAHEDVGTLTIGSGPVTSFGWLPTDGPPIAFARGPVPLVGQRLTGSTVDASATGPDRTTAAAKAIAELLERQAAYLRPRAPVRLDVHGDGGWLVLGRSLVDGRPAPVPTGRLVLASLSTTDGPGVGDSTGMAVGPDSRTVANAGLLEAVERAGVAAIEAHGPQWRLPAERLDGPYADAVRRAGWSLDVVGYGYAGFAVALCIATGAPGLNPADGVAPAGAAPEERGVATVGAAPEERGVATVGAAPEERGVASVGTVPEERGVASVGADMPIGVVVPEGGVTKEGGAPSDGAVRSVGGAAARIGIEAAAGAALAEAYVKVCALRSAGRATAASAPPFGLRWPDLPPPPRDRDDRGDGDPIEALRQSGLDAALIDRGNPAIDALGWRAAQVVLLPATGRPASPGLLAELLR